MSGWMEQVEGHVRLAELGLPLFLEFPNPIDLLNSGIRAFKLGPVKCKLQELFLWESLLTFLADHPAECVLLLLDVEPGRMDGLVPQRYCRRPCPDKDGDECGKVVCEHRRYAWAEAGMQIKDVRGKIVLLGPSFWTNIRPPVSWREWYGDSQSALNNCSVDDQNRHIFATEAAKALLQTREPLCSLQLGLVIFEHWRSCLQTQQDAVCVSQPFFNNTHGWDCRASRAQSCADSALLFLMVSSNRFRPFEVNPGSWECGCWRQGKPLIPCGFFSSGTCCRDPCKWCHNCSQKQMPSKQRRGRERAATNKILRSEAYLVQAVLPPARPLAITLQPYAVDIGVSIGLARVRHLQMGAVDDPVYEATVRSLLPRLLFLLFSDASTEMRAWEAWAQIKACTSCRNLTELGRYWKQLEESTMSPTVRDFWKLARFLVSGHLIWQPLELDEKLNLLQGLCELLAHYNCHPLVISEFWACCALCAGAALHLNNLTRAVSRRGQVTPQQRALHLLLTRGPDAGWEELSHYCANSWRKASQAVGSISPAPAELLAAYLQQARISEEEGFYASGAAYRTWIESLAGHSTE